MYFAKAATTTCRQWLQCYDMDMKYQPGMEILCPGCRQQSVVKLLRRVENWQTEEYLGCAFCQCRLADAPAALSSDCEKDAVANVSREKLLSFLGADRRLADAPKNSRRQDWLHDSDDSRFCRDCDHFLKHPFVCRCLLHNRPTEPMRDCADYVEAESIEGNEV